MRLSGSAKREGSSERQCQVLDNTFIFLLAAGYSSSIKFVPTSDGHHRADLHVVGARLMVKDDLVDVTVRHDFIGDARDVLRRGTLRNPDRPD